MYYNLTTKLNFAFTERDQKTLNKLYQCLDLFPVSEEHLQELVVKVNYYRVIGYIKETNKTIKLPDQLVLPKVLRKVERVVNIVRYTPNQAFVDIVCDYSGFNIDDMTTLDQVATATFEPYAFHWKLLNPTIPYQYLKEYHIDTVTYYIANVLLNTFEIGMLGLCEVELSPNSPSQQELQELIRSLSTKKLFKEV